MRRSDVFGDLVAGVVITAFLVPVGMGYSQAAGLPPVHGLYATVLPLLAYAVFGPSRILVLGPDSSLAPLIAASILPLASGDPARAVALAGALAIGSGILALAAGFARFGFVTELLSMPVRIGYLNGIAVVVILGPVARSCSGCRLRTTHRSAGSSIWFERRATSTGRRPHSASARCSSSVCSG